MIPAMSGVKFGMLLDALTLLLPPPPPPPLGLCKRKECFSRDQTQMLASLKCSRAEKNINEMRGKAVGVN